MAEKSIIYVDVGRLVEKVETRNLLFYPVMIHIFWQVMRNLYKGEVNEPCPVYQIMQGNGQNVLAWQEMKDDREAFFADYVLACYNHLQPNKQKKHDKMPVESFGVFYAEDEQTAHFETNLPMFMLHPFVHQDGKKLLPISVRGKISSALLMRFEQMLIERINSF